MSTTSTPPLNVSYGGYCTRCGKPNHGSSASEYAPGWPETKVEAVRLDPYFVYERIAGALERIAAAMEQNTGSEPE